jgi:hypothetical protein
MTAVRKIAKVFLASPGDLVEERRAAKSVVDEFNNQLADTFGYQVDLVGWEDTLPNYGRPQALINRDLEGCDLFVGMIWKRWGSPPDTGGPYTSGFEEEFQISVNRRESHGSPEISLFFKDIDSALLTDPGDQLKKVIEYRDKIIAEKKILFGTFSDSRDFETKLRRCIQGYVTGLYNRDIAETTEKSQSSTPPDALQNADQPDVAVTDTPLSSEGTTFLRGFITQASRATDPQAFSAADVARFRLLSTIVGTPNNDKDCLGVHDANMLYQQRDAITLGQSEIRGLIASGLNYYSHQNVPLWHWIAAVDGFTADILPMYSLIGAPPAERVGALSAMRLISDPLPSDIERDFFISRWLHNNSDSTLRIAALHYLGDCGIPSDLAAIRQEFRKNDSQTTTNAAEAIVRITLRESRLDAVRALYELQPASVPPDLVASLFKDPSQLTDELLLEGVTHRSSDVRRVVVQLLCSRRTLPNDIAEQLMKDADASVRYDAFQSVVRGGRAFTIEQAKTILVRPDQNRGGLGIFSFYGAKDSEGEARFPPV